MSVVLENVPNENYEPSEVELMEYGKWLGMELPADKPFLWIAREGLKAPLPEHWKACRSEKGELYYFNFKTGESSWDHPLDDQFRELLRSEKKNPSPRSVANGAKPKPLQSKKVGETLIDKTNSNEQPVSLQGGNSKIHALKRLKLKKELPADLKLEIKSGAESSSDLSSRGLGVSSPKEEITDMGCKIFKQSTEKITLNKNGESLDSAKNAFISDLEEKLQRFQSEKLKEHQITKDEYETRLKESWNRSRKRLEEEYEKKLKDLKDELEKKFRTEKNRLEEDHVTHIQQLNDEFTAKFEEEARQIRQHLNEKYEREKNDTEERFRMEVEDIQKNRSKELEKLRISENQGLDAMNDNTEGLKETTRSFIDTYKKAHDAFIGVLVETNLKYSNYGKIAVARLTESAKESYQREINSIKDCYYSEIEDIKRKFAADIVLLQKEKEELAKEKAELEEEYKTYLREKAEILEDEKAKFSFSHESKGGTQTLHESGQVQVMIEKCPNTAVQTKERGDQDNNALTSPRSEKEVLESVVAFMKENQKKELEEVKKDLRKRAEEELKAAFNDMMQEHRHMFVGSVTEGKDEVLSLQGVEKVPLELKTDDKEYERSATVSPEIIRKGDLTALLTEALRTVFAGSPFIIPSPTNGDDTTKKSPGCSEAIPIPPFFETKEPNLERRVDTFPVSFQEQKALLAGERYRIGEGKRFVENQRTGLEQRRFQLKTARHQWKQDVIAAKKEGIRSSSREGQLLNKLRITLENQAKGLEHDEAILRDSERWLLMKEQMVQQMERQINELEGRKTRDTSTNSLDTVALMTSFFKPTTRTADWYPQEKEPMREVVHTRTLSPMYGKTLDKIARRLEEVTSMMNIQKRKRGFSITHGNIGRRRSGQELTNGVEFILKENREF
ncbi:WW domain [Trypanosoma melophagium]|uniref:WW domain n=1 Tax=Trypanosoma melophagium TaxID=715481 RepID=UPI003519ED34|nr:WW domain [Trypanosoma melophagium]